MKNFINDIYGDKSFQFVSVKSNDLCDEVILTSYNAFNLSVNLKLSVTLPKRSFISCAFDGVFLYVARSSHIIECFDLAGGSVWVCEIDCCSEDLINDVIYCVSNYNKDFILCALDDFLGDVMFISKDNGNIIKSITLDCGAYKFFISDDRAYAQGMDNLYEIKDMAIKKFCKGMFLSLCVSGKNIYLLHSLGVVCVSEGVVLHKKDKKSFRLVELSIVGKFVYLMFCISRNTYVIELYDSALTFVKTVAKFESDYTAFFIPDFTSVIAYADSSPKLIKFAE